MNYFLKRYLPVTKRVSDIRVGVAPEFMELPNNEQIITYLEKLVKGGVTKEEIENTPLYKEMFDLNMLTQDKVRFRKEMYMDYLGAVLKPEKLNTKILLLGAGGMGSTTAYLLAQFGFKDLTIVDFDIVEASDIEKMVIYRNEHIGKLKTDALKSIIETQFNECNVKTISAIIKSKEQVQSIIEQSNAELIIRAMDPKIIAFRFWLSEICFAKKIPFIASSYAFEYVRLGPFLVPGMTACDNCFNLWLTEGLGDEFEATAQEKLFHDYSIHPAISFNINIASNLSLKDIIFFLAEKYEYVSSLGQTIDFEPLKLTGKSSTIPFHPKCNICQTSIN